MPPGQRCMELLEPGGIGLGRVGADAARFDEAQRAAVEVDDPESADGGPGVDAKGDHTSMVASAIRPGSSDRGSKELTAYEFCRTLLEVR